MMKETAIEVVRDDEIVETWTSVDEQVSFIVHDALVAMFLYLKLGIPCIVTGLDTNTQERFWLFHISLRECNIALEQYNEERIEFEKLFG